MGVVGAGAASQRQCLTVFRLVSAPAEKSFSNAPAGVGKCPDDGEFLKKRGVKYLVTTTPVIEGRSFGTNMLEAALVAAAGKKRVLSNEELNQIIDDLSITAQVQDLS